jgi:hypothetical protein
MFVVVGDPATISNPFQVEAFAQVLAVIVKPPAKAQATKFRS